MKKIILLVSFTLLFPFLLYSQWVDKGIYKEEILKINNLKCLHFNEDGTKFYTIHSNNFIYYWDAKTGILLDSLVLPDKTAIPNFSKDGRTLCYYLPITTDLGLKLPVVIAIYNLLTKSRITKSTIIIPDDITYNKPSQNSGWIYDQRQLTMLDFNFTNNELTFAVSFVYYYNVQIGAPQSFNYYTTCGGSGVFDVKADTVIKKRQTSAVTTYDIININNSIYLTLFLHARTMGGSASLNMDNTDFSFIFTKWDYSLSKSKNIKTGSYGTYSNYETGKGTTSGTYGQYKPFSRLFLDNLNNTLYVKQDSYIYYINMANDSIVDSLKLSNNLELVKLTNNNNDFIYYNQNQILVQSIKVKNIHDSYICPIVPISLELNPLGKDFIVANDSGNILLYHDVLQTGVEEIKENNKLSVSPNPSTDFIEISGWASLEPAPTEIRIYNMLGEVALVGILHAERERIDVSSLSPRLYFIRVGDKVSKFIKS